MKQIFLLIASLFFTYEAEAQLKVVERGFLYEGNLPPTCHAATAVETPQGDIIAAFFGGTYEGHPDSDIWICRRKKGSSLWSKPEVLADGVYTKHTRSAFEYDSLFPVICNRDSVFYETTWFKPAKNNSKALISNKVRKPCYNPVLYTNAQNEIVLDYKIGSNMQDWTGWEIKSKNGRKWSHPRPLAFSDTERHLTLGPIKNKPLVSNGRIIAGSSTEVTYDSWCVHFETSDDDGCSWIKREVECDTILCIQPALLNMGNGHIKALCRTRHNKMATTESFDNGSTWKKMSLTDFPNNNSGIDALTLNNGRHLLVYNDTPNPQFRSPLSIAISNDGNSWEKVIDLEDDDHKEYSYPCIIQASDGSIWVFYTWHRQKIAYAKIILE